MKIEIVPYGTDDERSRGIFRGWKWIKVDSVPWGVAVMRNRGPHGVYYTLHQSRSNTPALNDPRPGARQPLYVCSDVGAYQRWRYSGMKGERPKKLPERLIDAVQLCIKHKLLISPEAVALRTARAEEKRLAAQAARDAAERKRWVARIERELGPIERELGPGTIDAAIRLMKWAQSQ